jgi:DNA-binding MarR family transcriptional regulator
MLVCLESQSEQTAAEIAEALGVSRSAVGTAIGELERWRIVERIRLPGERADHVRLPPDYATQSLENADEYAGLAAICRQGLQAIADSTPERRARLEEMVAFADFLVERMPQLAAEWRERRKSLRPDREENS